MASTNSDRTRMATQIQKSLSDLSAFVASQEARIGQARDALKKGYAAEAIMLSTHQIHAVLRRGLWVMGQLTAFKDVKQVLEDDQLFGLLANREVMPAGVGDKELYYAAEKFHFLDADEGKQLGKLLNQTDYILNEIYSRSQPHAQEEYDKLKDIAETFVLKTEIAIARLAQHLQELQQKLEPALKDFAQ